MITVGLTGGIGSGKSYISAVFNHLGVPVFAADQEAKKVYSYPGIRKKVEELLGTGSYLINNQIDRAYIASKIFENKNLLGQLNKIIHPEVGIQFQSWSAKLADKKYVIKESAILFESGSWQNLDFVICVTAPRETRIKRVIERDNVSREEVLKRMSNQWLQDELVSQSDFIIENDGINLVLPQIIHIHNKLLT